jgi:hypothetical protein
MRGYKVFKILQIVFLTYERNFKISSRSATQKLLTRFVLSRFLKNAIRICDHSSIFGN